MANLLNSKCLHDLKRVSNRLCDLEKDTERIEADARKVKQDIGKIRAALDRLFLDTTKKGVSNEQNQQGVKIG